jgi:hypothetical protein
MTNRKCHILSKNRMNKGPSLMILHLLVGPVHHAPLRYWVQIPRYLPVSPPAAPPVNPAPRIMATPKLVGTAPEPFDGKPDKAEPFMYQLQNYYYLNEASFTDES